MIIISVKEKKRRLLSINQGNRKKAHEKRNKERTGLAGARDMSR